jgi:hypothetical protein
VHGGQELTAQSEASGIASGEEPSIVMFREEYVSDVGEAVRPWLG